jgi:ERCC4-related helicase
MEIWNTPPSKQNVIIKSIIWNTIIEVFNVEKNIDITNYLNSIKINGEKITVKTTKPIINAELQTIDDKIKQSLIEKLWKLWINFSIYEIKYI